MSGLVTFFKDFFPDVQNIDYSRSLENLHDGECDMGTDVDMEQPENGNDNDSENIGNENNNNNKHSHSEGSNLEFTPEPWTCKQWRDFQKDSLRVYFQRRLSAEDDEEEDGDEDEDDENGYYETEPEDEEEEDESLGHDNNDEDDDDEDDDKGQWDTQQQHPPQVQVASVTSPKSRNQQQLHNKKHKQRRIPHLEQAIHSVEKLAFLDMYTSDLSLKLTKVIKVWRMRDTKRGIANSISLKNDSSSSSSSSNDKKYTNPVFPGRMPRIPFSHKEEDGPLSSTFKQVLSLEVEQVGLPSGNGSGGHHNKRRLRLFLYNAYAKAVWDWLEHQQQQQKQPIKSNTPKSNDCKYVLSLSHVPAICILPYSLDPRNWLDQEGLLGYCICIGDLSSLKYNVDGDITPMRLDSPELQLRLAKTNTSSSGSKNVTSKDLVLSKKILEEGTAEVTDELSRSWKEYKKSMEPPALPVPPQPPVTTPPPPQPPTNTAPLPQTQVASSLPPATLTAVLPPLQLQQLVPIAPSPPLVVVGQATAQDTSSTLAEASGVGDSTTARQKEVVPPQQQQQQAPVPASPTVLPPVLPPQPTGPMNFEGPAQKRQRVNSYSGIKYVRLSALRDLFKEHGKQTLVKCNTYAAILGFTSPCQTKRGDWMMTVTTVDETCTKPVTLVIFCKQANNLPKLLKMGDVLRMHRVSLQEWKGDIQIVGKISSSYVAVRKAGERWDATPTATTSFVFDEKDEQRSQELWHWVQDWIVQRPTINAKHRFTLAEVMTLADQEEEKVRDRDLTVMIAAKYPYPANARTGITPCGFLRVWDGTGEAPSDPFPIPTILAQTTQDQGDPPSEAVAKVDSIVQQLQISGESSDLATPKALCGRVSNAMIWEESHWKLINETLEIGSFLRLRNVDVRRWKNNEFRSFMVHSKSWLTPLPDATYEIRVLLEEHNQRMARSEFNPQSGLLPRMPPTSVVEGQQRIDGAGTGLMNFVNSSNGQYTGMVQLLKTIPNFDSSFQPFCKITRDGSGFAYRFAVTLADDSTCLTAIVQDTAGESIFGMPASRAIGASGARRRNGIVNPDSAWKAKIRSVEANGVKYFVLVGLSQDNVLHV